MPTWINKATLYIFAWGLYWTQGAILPVGGIATTCIVVVLILVSLYYAYIANMRYKLPLYFMGLNILLAMFTFYGIILIFEGFISTDYTLYLPPREYLKKIYISLLPIYPFFVFTRENLFQEKHLIGFVIFFFIIATICFFINYKIQLLAALLDGSDRNEFINNTGYLFLALIPACSFLRKNVFLQYFALCYCMYFIIMGMKRGAIFIGILSMFWFFKQNIVNVSMKKKISYIIMLFLVVLVGYMFVQKQINESKFFQKRIEDTKEGNASGRDHIYAFYVDYFWNKTTPIQFFFGSGAYATIKVGKIEAHMDWLEIALNQGLLGLMIYAFYWSIFLKECLSKAYGGQEKTALQLLFMIFFIKSFFSMSYNVIPISATFILGYCLAQEKNNEQVIYCN